MAPSATGPVALLACSTGSARSRRVAIIRNGVVAIDRVTIAPNRLAASRRDQQRVLRLREQHEAELAALAEQQARAPSAGRQLIPNASADAR